MYPAAQKRFCFIFATVALESFITFAISPGSDFIKIIFAVSRATSVPAPMAIPTSALTKAGASFIPSPNEHTITLEKSKAFKEINLRVSYKKDFDKPFQGWGPYINFDIPIFDSNYAQVSRTKFLLKQAQNDLADKKIKVKEELSEYYSNFVALKKEIVLYENSILPSYKKSVEFTQKYADIMQLSMVSAIEAKIKYLEAESGLIDRRFSVQKSYTMVEKALGTDLKFFPKFLADILAT